MLLYPLLGLSLLVTSWQPASAFRPRVRLPQQPSGRNRSKHDRRRSAPDHAGAAAAAAPETTASCPPQPRSLFLQPGESRRSAGDRPAEGSGVVTHGNRNIIGPRKKRECGAMSLTRSQLLSFAALAAAVVLGPRRASAVDSSESAGTSAADSIESTVAFGSQELVDGAKYMVGSDEVCVTLRSVWGTEVRAVVAMPPCEFFPVTQSVRRIQFERYFTECAARHTYVARCAPSGFRLAMTAWHAMAWCSNR